MARRRHQLLKVNVWRGQAENLAESLGKGDRVMATGRLRQRSWDTPEGEKRSVTELEADEVGASLKWATAKGDRPSLGSPFLAAASRLRNKSRSPWGRPCWQQPRRPPMAKWRPRSPCRAALPALRSRDGGIPSRPRAARAAGPRRRPYRGQPRPEPAASSPRPRDRRGLGSVCPAAGSLPPNRSLSPLGRRGWPRPRPPPATRWRRRCGAQRVCRLPLPGTERHFPGQGPPERHGGVDHVHSDRLTSRHAEKPPQALPRVENHARSCTCSPWPAPAGIQGTMPTSPLRCPPALNGRGHWPMAIRSPGHRCPSGGASDDPSSGPLAGAGR